MSLSTPPLAPSSPTSPRLEAGSPAPSPSYPAASSVASPLLEADPRAFIRAHTVVARPPLCPELPLHLITDACPLWTAREADLARLGLEPPYWAFCWPGGQALARYLLDQPALVAGRSVLDFGAGSGIEALAALKAGAARALASDIDPLSVTAMRLNAALNDLPLEVTDADLVGTDDGWEVVLAGDVFYEPALAGLVFPWLQRLAARGALVLLGDPHRGYLPTTALIPRFECLAPADGDPHGQYRKWTTVFEVAPPHP